MENVMRTIYKSLYQPLEHAETNEQIEKNFQLLMHELNDEQCTAVLQIIDDKDYIEGNISFDSFVHGFLLGMGIKEQLEQYIAKNEIK